MRMRAASARNHSLREIAMTIKSKLAAAVAVLALAGALTIPTSAAHAGKYGWGIAAGVVGGAIVAGAIANSYA
jgi:hypothetical protein